MTIDNQDPIVRRSVWRVRLRMTPKFLVCLKRTIFPNLQHLPRRFWPFQSPKTPQVLRFGGCLKVLWSREMLLTWEHEWRHQYSQFSLRLKHTHRLFRESCQQFIRWVNHEDHDWPLTCISVEHSYMPKHSQPCCDVRVGEESEVSSPVSAIPEYSELKYFRVVVMAR